MFGYKFNGVLIIIKNNCVIMLNFINFYSVCLMQGFGVDNKILLLLSTWPRLTHSIKSVQ